MPRVITTALSTVVGAPRRRVWRALTDPAEILRWDERTIRLLEPVSQPPAAGSVYCWRYLLGGIPVVLREETLDLVAEERLHSGVYLGLFHYEQTFTLADEGADTGRTRLSLRVTTGNSVAVVGGNLDRFAVRRQAAELVDSRLRALQKWCESAPASAPQVR